jgi:hypothetical protein
MRIHWLAQRKFGFLALDDCESRWLVDRSASFNRKIGKRKYPPGKTGGITANSGNRI